MTTTLRALAYVGKIASIVTGGAVFAQSLPASWAIPAAIAFGVASVVKDAAKDIGDYLDDGKRNDSFKVD